MNEDVSPIFRNCDFPASHGKVYWRIIHFIKWPFLLNLSQKLPPKLLMSKGRMDMELHTMVDDAKLILVLYPGSDRASDKKERQTSCWKVQQRAAL